MSRMDAYARLVERGCLCGTDAPADCTLHGPGDNRGIAAYFAAGQPRGFPLVARCSVCGAGGLLYPNIDIDDPKRDGAFRPTLVCPGCSVPAGERALRADAENFGYVLNERLVFPAPLGEVAA